MSFRQFTAGSKSVLPLAGELEPLDGVSGPPVEGNESPEGEELESPEAESPEGRLDSAPSDEPYPVPYAVTVDAPDRYKSVSRRGRSFARVLTREGGERNNVCELHVDSVL